MEVTYDENGKVVEIKSVMRGSEIVEMFSASNEVEKLKARIAELEELVRWWRFNRDTWKDRSDEEERRRLEAEQNLARDEAERNRDALRRVYRHLEDRFSSEFTEPSKYRRDGALKLLAYCKDYIDKFEGE